MSRVWKVRIAIGVLAAQAAMLPWHQALIQNPGGIGVDQMMAALILTAMDSATGIIAVLLTVLPSPRPTPTENDRRQG